LRELGPEIVLDGRLFIVLYPDGTDERLQHPSKLSPHASLRAAFSEACGIANWDRQDLDAIGPVAESAAEVLT